MSPVQAGKKTHLEHVHPSREWSLGVSEALEVVRLCLHAHAQVQIACMKRCGATLQHDMQCMCCTNYHAMHDMKEALAKQRQRRLQAKL